jgi:methylated-DNA-[protein]-cysteine S-methyltransferase
VTSLAWATLDTPVGPVSVGCTGDGLARVRFGPPPAASGGPGPGAGPSAGADGLAAGADEPSAGADLLAARARQQIAEYFRGERRVFELPVDWPAVVGRAGVTGVRQRVLAELHAHVGFGKTITYGALAGRAQVPGDGQTPPARVVGQIMASNPCPLVVACHRVLAGGGLGGFSGGTGVEVKRWLLTFEGSLPPTLDWDPAGMNASGTARA